MRTKLTFILLFVLVFISCKKDPSIVNNNNNNSNNNTKKPYEPVYSGPVNAELLATLAFKSGSWWKYIDTLTLDTFTVIGASSLTSNGSFTPGPAGPGQGPAGPTYYYEYVETVFSHQIKHFLKRYILCKATVHPYTPAGPGNWGLLLFDYNYTNGFISRNAIVNYDSLELSGKTFYKVSKQLFKHDSTTKKDTTLLDNTHYYFNKDFGIVKIEIPDSILGHKVYHLVDWNIVR